MEWRSVSSSNGWWNRASGSLCFTVCTDHKPLLGLFGESRAIQALASSRIQRWPRTATSWFTSASQVLLMPTQMDPVYYPYWKTWKLTGSSRLCVNHESYRVNKNHIIALCPWNDVFVCGLDSDMLFIIDHLRNISIFCQLQCWLSKENISFCFKV